VAEVVSVQKHTRMADRAGRGFVVADDERQLRATRIGLLHLRLEMPPPAIHDDRVARIAQRFRDAAGRAFPPLRRCARRRPAAPGRRWSPARAGAGSSAPRPIGEAACEAGLAAD